MNYSTEYTFIGITYTSTARNIFRAHYTAKEDRGLSLMRTTLAAEGYTGPLPVWEGRLLYMARIDPHLVSGCEVSLDIDNSLLDKLKAIQRTFLRCLLRLQSRSMRVILFSETGIAFVVPGTASTLYLRRVCHEGELQTG